MNFPTLALPCKGSLCMLVMESSDLNQKSCFRPCHGSERHEIDTHWKRHKFESQARAFYSHFNILNPFCHRAIAPLDGQSF